MNATEAEALLKTVKVIDARIGKVIDPLQVALWAEMLADVPYKAAEAAMKEHYRTSTDLIMPGHVRPLVKKLMGAWKEQQRLHEAREQAKRPAIEAQSLPGEVGDRREVMAAVDRSSYSSRKAAAIEHMRAVTPPSRPVHIGGSMRSGRAAKGARDANQAPRGPMPERLGGLLRTVRAQVKPPREDAA